MPRRAVVRKRGRRMLEMLASPAACLGTAPHCLGPRLAASSGPSGGAAFMIVLLGS